MSAERQDEFQINIKTFLWLKHLPVSLTSLNLAYCIFRCNFFILPTFYVLICISLLHNVYILISRYCILFIAMQEQEIKGMSSRTSDH